MNYKDVNHVLATSYTDARPESFTSENELAKNNETSFVAFISRISIAHLLTNPINRTSIDVNDFYISLEVRPVNKTNEF
jgi:hypothetical protein